MSESEHDNHFSAQSWVGAVIEFLRQLPLPSPGWWQDQVSFTFFLCSSLSSTSSVIRVPFPQYADAHCIRIRRIPPTVRQGIIHFYSLEVTSTLTNTVLFSGIITGQLEGRGSYPTTYGGYCDVWKCSWRRKDSGTIGVFISHWRLRVH